MLFIAVCLQLLAWQRAASMLQWNVNLRHVFTCCLLQYACRFWLNREPQSCCNEMSIYDLCLRVVHCSLLAALGLTESCKHASMKCQSTTCVYVLFIAVCIQFLAWQRAATMFKWNVDLQPVFMCCLLQSAYSSWLDRERQPCLNEMSIYNLCLRVVYCSLHTALGLTESGKHASMKCRSTTCVYVLFIAVCIQFLAWQRAASMLQWNVNLQPVFMCCLLQYACSSWLGREQFGRACCQHACLATDGTAAHWLISMQCYVILLPSAACNYHC